MTTKRIFRRCRGGAGVPRGERCRPPTPIVAKGGPAMLVKTPPASPMRPRLSSRRSQNFRHEATETATMTYASESTVLAISPLLKTARGDSRGFRRMPRPRWPRSQRPTGRVTDGVGRPVALCDRKGFGARARCGGSRNSAFFAAIGWRDRGLWPNHLRCNKSGAGSASPRICHMKSWMSECPTPTAMPRRFRLRASLRVD